MLLTDNDLLNQPILSLQTGKKIAQISYPIVNPEDLSIVAFELSGRFLDKDQESFLLVSDIREQSKFGMIIDSSDEIVAKDDVINLRQILDLEFELINLPVYDQKNNFLGKVKQYTIVPGFFLIYQLIVDRPLLKSWFDNQLIIDRKQIIDVKPDRIIIKQELASSKQSKYQKQADFVNPFRNKKQKTIQAIKK